MMGRREGEKEMMLGKRPRPPMRRTASMTGLPADSVEVESPELPACIPCTRERQRQVAAPQAPRRRHSLDILTMETAAFLRACGLCNRRLGPGRDTFMYRGEIAFCSLECREQQMNRDERMENCSLTSMKTDTPMATQGAEATTGGETVAAV